MQDEEINADADQLVLNEVPGQYEVAGFTESYEKYLKQDIEQKNFCNIAYVVSMVLGLLISAVGFLTLVFGPSSVRIVYGEMTFIQFIQLYPGPIVSVRCLILFINQWIGSACNDYCMSKEAYLLTTWAIVVPDDVLHEGNLRVAHVEGDVFRFDMAPLPES